MMQWETLILQTTQIGGSLVFISDKAPSFQGGWIQALTENCHGMVPFVVRSKEQLCRRAFQTKSQDLVIFFESQQTLIEELNPFVQGQRWVIAQSDKMDKVLHTDYIWTSASLNEWKHLVSNLSAKWNQVQPLQEFASSSQAPCLFLDRDDVVVKNVPYNKDPEKVELFPGITELINKAHQLGYWVAVVTNQSGLGRGWITWPEYQAVHQRILKLLAEQGCWIDEWVWAAFYEGGVPAGERMASLRKPRNGMFQLVEEKLRPNLSRSIMVGDSASDLIAAYASGVKGLYLLSSAKLDQEKAELAKFQKQFEKFKFSVAEKFSDVSL
ncbi:D-glycero-alpha-D-manno-heptose-1,7-bisphosphate 7-phosphatase [Bdellovibrio reynosensis]|uniref:D,D-heptose 1,7-bisphosphate phosphatase n=1 Tax=Bdellovibrio reynosensis TaxID=2835041 RepID=A0ABY4CGA5_9BACT|nr:HAD-IIIA family hydrolase [Bdellovibrio reynosensis]UOF01240.1 HAD-IIIA family hydrolase [Bdellovibrio reynosensis]